MTRNPFLLPPGPERRELMEQRGLNISQNDWTPEEWAEIQAQAAASLEVFAAMDSPPDLR